MSKKKPKKKSKVVPKKKKKSKKKPAKNVNNGWSEPDFSAFGDCGAV